MAEFVWEARARTGELRKGSMEAESEDAVNQRLRAQQLQPTKVKKKAKALSFQIGTGVGDEGHRHLHAPLRDDDRRRPAHRAVPRHPPGADGQQALRRHPCGREGERRAGRDVQRLAAPAPQGLRPPLHEPRPGRRGGRHPRHDPEPPRGLHREGDEAAAARCAARWSTRASSSSSSSACSTILLVFVIPGFENMFKDFGVEGRAAGAHAVWSWPCRERSSSATSSASSSALTGAHRRAQLRLPDAARARSSSTGMLLRCPSSGAVLRKIAVARFTRTLGTLLSSGVPILDALEIVAKTAGNVVVEEAIMYARAEDLRRQEHGGAADGDERLPADGRADGRRRRADRRARHDAQQDRRLLRGRGRRRRRRADEPHRAGA